MSHVIIAAMPMPDWLLLAALFVLGSLFGSFANVVIYRAPLGKSLLWPGSHCPACGHPIRWYDNVPVLSWLLLGGKCRDCHAPFSARYPLVEALFGALLAALGWLELTTEGAKLLATSPGPAGDLPLVGYHMLLLGMLVVAALIHWDGKRIPLGLFGFALIVALVSPIFFRSGFRPAALDPELYAPLAAGPILRAVVDLVAGLAAGALLGSLAWPALAQRSSPDRSGAAAVFELTTIGGFLGWQAACGIALFALACDLVAAIGERAQPALRRAGWPIWLALGTLEWLALWPMILRRAPIFGRQDLSLLVACGAAMAIGSLAAWRVRQTADARAG